MTKKTLDVTTLINITKKNQSLFTKNFIDYFRQKYGSRKVDIWEVIHDLEEQKDCKGSIPMLFKQFKLTGLCKSWHDNGNLRYEENYKKGKLDGLFFSFYPNKALESRSFYKNDKKDGISVAFTDDNEELYEECYKKGVRDGLCFYYNADGSGTLRYHERWKNGKLLDVVYGKVARKI